MFGLFKKKKESASLKSGLSATKSGLLERLGKAVMGKSIVDEAVLDQIEAALIAADIGVPTTIKLIEQLEQQVARDKYLHTSEVDQLLRTAIKGLFPLPAPIELQHPHVIMVVGVNGVGKTTTIAKLAYAYQQQGKSVLLGAGDTFRAAAVSQIMHWGSRLAIPVVSHGQPASPSGVAYDTIKRAVEEKAEVVLLDTAGRLHNKAHLMEELAKIKRTIQKVLPNAPHEVLMVVDGSTGQNAIQQVKTFQEGLGLDALAITKLDGTAKGGVVLGIVDQLGIPIRYIGVGEQPEDLYAFEAESYVTALLGEDPVV